ncbi:MAG: SAF domain-containing protein [Propionibacteriaceae bacterium]|jgi:Flp pilus assembly protein CpaB|nr:SAF domain-containing protein [Propionibacteriaceae bacterium]
MPGFFSSLRWGLSRHRRLLAALAAGVAVLAGLSAITQGQTEVPVLVAAHEIASGSKLTSADLRVSRWPAAIVPDRALTTAEEAIGQISVAAITERAPITASDLLEEGQLVAPGLVALPLSFATSSPIDLLQVGSTIDIIGPDPATGMSKVLVSGARVVSVPESSGTSWANSAAKSVLIEVTPSAAATLNSAAAISSLSFALH